MSFRRRDLHNRRPDLTRPERWKKREERERMQQLRWGSDTCVLTNYVTLPDAPVICRLCLRLGQIEEFSRSALPGRPCFRHIFRALARLNQDRSREIESSCAAAYGRLCRWHPPPCHGAEAEREAAERDNQACPATATSGRAGYGCYLETVCTTLVTGRVLALAGIFSSFASASS